MLLGRIGRVALLALAAVVALAGCGSRRAVGGASTAAAAGSATPARVTRAPEADWPTFDYNSARTGVGPTRTGINGRNLHSLRARVIHIDGTVDSAPIELQGLRLHGRRRDVVYVTTTYGRTLALDAGTGQKLWEYRPADIASYERSPQVTTTTPVADPDRRFVYAASPDGLIHKLSTVTGVEVRRHWPVRVSFDPRREKMDGALNLSGRSLIAVTGGYIGDAPVYQGHLVLIDRASGRITRVFNTLCSDRTSLIDPPRACPHSDSAIWARAGSVVEPGSGRLLIATGNGTNGDRASFNGRTDWANSVLELSPAARLLHNWTPPNQQALSDSDADIGSSAPALVTVGGRRLAIQGAKDGRLHLLDLTRLNGTSGPASARLGGELQAVSSPGGGEVLTAPAVWSHAGGSYAFVADDSGTAAYRVRGGAHPALAVVWREPEGGTSPVLAGGLLYVYDAGAGALDVYDPVSGARVDSLAAGQGHWNSPIVVGGRIILPVGSYHAQALSGTLYIWHLPGR